MLLEIQRVAVDLTMTVRAEQHALVDLTFDARPSPGSCFTKPKVLLTGIKVMELKGSHALLVATDPAFTAFVPDGSYLPPTPMFRNGFYVRLPAPL